jgi:hypothetical protein
MTEQPYAITTTVPDMGRVEIERRLEATLDDAQQRVVDLVYDRCVAFYAGRDWTGRKAAIAALVEAAFNLPESGGTIGPLPDGTRFEVKPIRGERP